MAMTKSRQSERQRVDIGKMKYKTRPSTWYCSVLCVYLYFSSISFDLKSFTVPLIFLFNRNSLVMYVLYVKWLPFSLIHIRFDADHFQRYTHIWSVFYFSMTVACINSSCHSLETWNNWRNNMKTKNGKDLNLASSFHFILYTKKSSLYFII